MLCTDNNRVKTLRRVRENCKGICTSLQRTTQKRSIYLFLGDLLIFLLATLHKVSKELNIEDQDLVLLYTYLCKYSKTVQSEIMCV